MAGVTQGAGVFAGQDDLVAAGWKLLTASVTGRAHLARKQGNEDALGCARLADGTLILALADGAGSARNAAEGAQLAVEAAVASLDERLGQDEAGTSDLEAALREGLAEARRAVALRLRQSRSRERTRARDLSSTLLLAVVKGETLAVLQLGDGAVLAREAAGWSRITRPLRGIHAGETTFATSRGAARLVEIEVRSLAGTEALALLSDGLEPVATDMASGEPHGPFFDPLVTFARRAAPRERLEGELAEFLGSDRVQSRSSDDLSLILAVRNRE